MAEVSDPIASQRLNEVVKAASKVKRKTILQIKLIAYAVIAILVGAAIGAIASRDFVATIVIGTYLVFVIGHTSLAKRLVEQNYLIVTMDALLNDKELE